MSEAYPGGTVVQDLEELGIEYDGVCKAVCEYADAHKRKKLFTVQLQGGHEVICERKPLDAIKLLRVK